MDDDSEIDLELAMRVDELAGEYAAAVGSRPALTPEAFAAEHPEVPRDALLAVLRGAGLLARAARRAEGPFAVGSAVGPYEIRRVLGRGGMGIVYEAVERELGRVVALKAVDSLHPDERTRARFVREARAAAQLDHPDIVPVFGSGETDGVLWYAMRRVRGESLDHVLRDLRSDDRGRRERARSALDDSASSSGSAAGSGAVASLPPRVRAGVALGARLAGALAYAHSRGILHRDIKPGNVLLDSGGAPLLTDFGLCKVEDDATLTAASDLVGTLRYMPPEALEGSYDARGDVYSLGLVVYEILSGRPAFSSDSRQAMLHQVLRVDPPALGEASGSRIPPDLERVVAKAIAKLPEERYGTAAEFAADLEALLAGRPVRARRPSALYQARLFVRRNRALSATVALAMAAAVAGTAAYVVQLRDANQRVGRALDEARRNEAEARLAGAEARLQKHDMLRARELLAGVGEEHRGWMWSHLAARVGLGRRADRVDLRDPQGSLQNDAQDLLVLFGSGGLVAFERDGLREIGRLEGSFVRGAIGGDGRDLYLTGTRPMKLLHVRVGTDSLTPRVLRGLEPTDYALAAREGSTTILLRRGLDTIAALDGATGEELWERRFPVDEVTVFSALSDDELVLGTRGGGVYAIGRDAPRPELLAEHVGNPSALLVRDGELLASGSDDGSIHLHPALTGHADGWLTVDGAVDSFALARDGSGLLAVALWNRSTLLVRPSTCCVERVLTGYSAMPNGVGFGRDPWLVTSTWAGELARHGPDAHDGRISLTPGLGDLGPPAASPDGRRVAAYGADWILYVHDLATGSMRHAPVGSRDRAASPSFDRTGALLALGRAVLQVETLEPHHLLEFSSSVVDSRFTGEGSLFAVATSSDGGARREGAPVQAVRCDGLEPGGEPVEERAALGPVRGGLVGLELSGDRAFLAFSGGTVLCIQVSTMEVRWRARVEVDELVAAAAGGGELYLVARDGVVRVLDPSDGAPAADRAWRITTDGAAQGLVSGITAGPAPGLLTTCTSDGRLEVWRTEDGHRLGALAEQGSWLRHVTPLGASGWLVASGYFGRLSLFGSGEAPVADTVDRDAMFTVHDAAALYREHGVLQRRLLGAAQRSQRFRHQPTFWEGFLAAEPEAAGAPQPATSR